jgi:hypothetical protein
MNNSVRQDPSVRWFLLWSIPFAAMAISHLSWGPTAGMGDYAQYLLHAESIIQGRPYAETGYIFHPAAWTIGPRAYPPGLPLTLAPLVAAFGTHSGVYRLLMVLCVGGFGWLSFLRLRKDVEPWQAAAAAGFAMFVLEARGATLAPISDPGFALLAWAMVLLIDSTRQWTLARGLAVAALGGAAVAYRLAGVALLAAFGLYALISWRQHRGRALVPLGVWALAGVGALLNGVVRIGDLTAFVAGFRGVDDRLERYAGAVFEMALYPSTIPWFNNAYHIVSSLLILIGTWVLVKRMWNSYMVVLFLTYVAMLLTAEVDSGRYVWPLFPVGVVAFAVGTTAIFEGVRRWLPRVNAPRLAVAMLACVAAAATLREIVRPRPHFLVGSPDGEALFTYLRSSHAKAPMRVVFSNPRVVTLETGVPAMGNVGRSPAGHLAAYDEKAISHLIWEVDSLADCLQKVANTLPESHSDRFVQEYSNSTFRVYRVVPSPNSPPEAFRRLRWAEYEHC